MERDHQMKAPLRKDNNWIKTPNKKNDALLHIPKNKMIRWKTIVLFVQLLFKLNRNQRVAPMLFVHCNKAKLQQHKYWKTRCHTYKKRTTNNQDRLEKNTTHNQPSKPTHHHGCNNTAKFDSTFYVNSSNSKSFLPLKFLANRFIESLFDPLVISQNSTSSIIHTNSTKISQK